MTLQIETPPELLKPSLPCCERYQNQLGQTYILTDILIPALHFDPQTSEDHSLNVHALPAASANRWGEIPIWALQDPSPRSPVLEQVKRLEEGRAIFAPKHATSDCAHLLYKAEANARSAKRGLWKETHIYSSAQPDVLIGKAGQYVIARGRLLSLGKTARTRYLNFGRSWKHDVTATISTKRDVIFSQYLEKQGLDWPDLEGRVVEVRGYISNDDGPHFELTHPGQLVVLDKRNAKP
ncbi:putative nuclease [Roseibium sp. TrichSKD4]|nr:putative nuclease [Roseibium sp. TrichSKD4]